MEERRKHGRKQPYFRVVCWTSDVPMKRLAAESVNISIGGICLRLKKVLNANEIMRLRIQNGFWQKPIEALGRIIWQDGYGISGKTMAGIRFISVPWSQIEELLYA